MSDNKRITGTGVVYPSQKKHKLDPTCQQSHIGHAHSNIQVYQYIEQKENTSENVNDNDVNNLGYDPTTITVDYQKKSIVTKVRNIVTSEVKIEDIFNVLNLGVEFDETTNTMKLLKDGETLADTTINIQNNVTNVTNITNESIEGLPYIWRISVGERANYRFFTDTWKRETDVAALENEVVVNTAGQYTSTPYIKMYAANSSRNLRLSISMTFIKFVLSTYEKEIVRILNTNDEPIFKNVKNIDDVMNLIGKGVICGNINDYFSYNDIMDIYYDIKPFKSIEGNTQCLGVRAYLKCKAKWEDGEKTYYFDLLTSQNITNSPISNRVPIITCINMFDIANTPRFMGYFNNNNHYFYGVNTSGYSGPMFIKDTTLQYYSSAMSLNSEGAITGSGSPAYLYASSTPMTPSKMYILQNWLGDEHFDDMKPSGYNTVKLGDKFSLPFKSPNLCGWVMFAFSNNTVREIVF